MSRCAAAAWTERRKTTVYLFDSLVLALLVAAGAVLALFARCPLDWCALLALAAVLLIGGRALARRARR